jgi:hypothetical protein
MYYDPLGVKMGKYALLYFSYIRRYCHLKMLKIEEFFLLSDHKFDSNCESTWHTHTHTHPWKWAGFKELAMIFQVVWDRTVLPY